MRFTFTQSSMEKGLLLVMGTISTRVPMPSLSNLHLKLEGKVLEITATDLEVTTTAYIELLDSEGSGDVLVPAKRFQEIIRQLPDVPLEITIPEPGKVFLRGDFKGEYKLPGGDPVDFPELPPIDPKISFSFSGEDLKRMISKTLFAVSRDEMRPVLNGLLFQVRPGELTVVATDGHKLSKIVKTGLDYNDDPIDVIIPTKALGILQKTLEFEDNPVITLAETRASFKTDHQILITRLIEGYYPRFESVIPEDNPKRLRANASDFVSAIRRVHIFSSQLSHQVRLKIEADSVTIQSEDQELGGEGSESVNITFEGEEMEIAYNGSYLMDVLRQIGTEDVIFEMKGFEDAAIIKPTSQEENEDFLMLLMPIRLQ